MKWTTFGVPCAGFWFQRVQDNENTASRRLGQASFASLQTFLQGTVTTFQVVPSPTELGWRSIFAAWYVQDKIRLRHNVTLELGLRHGLNLPSGLDPGQPVALVIAETEAAIKKRPAAFPIVFPVSSFETTGIAELRGAIARLLAERGAGA